MEMIVIAIIIILIFLLPFYFLAAYNPPVNTQNIDRVEIVDSTKVYQEKFENTGFSIGTNGHGRAYFGKRKRLKGTEVTFLISYTDKPQRTVKAMEGSNQYNTLMEYIYRQDEEEKQRKKSQKETIPSSGTSTIQAVQTVPSAEIKQIPQKEKPKYLEIPFEILPNEYSLEITHQTCIYQLSYGNHETVIRGEARYNPDVRGITNRKLVISIYDKDGHIMGVKSSFSEYLDKSGCKIIDATFYKTEEEPAKVSIGIEKRA